MLSTLLLTNCTKDFNKQVSEFDKPLKALISQSAKSGDYSYYILPTVLDSIPADKYNPLTSAKVELGNMLFFETGLALDGVYESSRGTWSCATCHIPEAGFKPGKYQGIADGGVGFGVNGEGRRMNLDYQENEIDVQGARAMNLINVAFVANTAWNGAFGATDSNAEYEDIWGVHDHLTEANHTGFQGLEAQIPETINLHRIRIDKETLANLGYDKLFDEAFPEFAGQDTLYTNQFAAFALAAYLRSVIGNKAPFQDWLKGDANALTENQKEGAMLFFGKANCSTCHYEPNLGSLEYHVLGVQDVDQYGGFNAQPDDKRYLGRFGFTGDEEDMYKFKVPGIYNVADSKFFFHGASKLTLEDLIDYKNEAVSENPRISNDLLSEKFLPLSLTEEEKANLADFIRNGLRDPDLVRYYPQNGVLSGQCFPNADSESIRDLNCN